MTMLLLLSALGACTASRIEPNLLERSRYAPANEEAVDGEIAYLDAEARKVRNARRDAYRKMHDFCGGEYIIAREEAVESARLLGLGGKRCIRGQP